MLYQGDNCPFKGAGQPSSTPGEQDRIEIITTNGVGALVEVADTGTVKTYRVRDGDVDRGYLTVESQNGNDLVVGWDVFFV